LFDAVFVSDLHLSADIPPRTRAFTAFLDGLRTRKLYILGDLFDFWVGDDHLTLFERSGLIEALEGLARRGAEILIMPGNRDFLLSEKVAAKLSARLLPEYHQIPLPSGRTLLLHGDQLLLNDMEYMLFRAAIRRRTLWALYRMLPFRWRTAFAHTMRQQSRSAVKRKRKHRPRILRFSRIALRQLLNSGFRCVICGHLHRPALITFSTGGETLSIYVLGQWTQEGGSFFALNSGRLTFHTFRI